MTHRLLSVAFLFLISVLVIHPRQNIEALSDQQRRLIDSGALYVNVESSECSVLNQASSGSVYVIGGDLVDSSRGELASAFSGAGWAYFVDSEAGASLQANTVDLIEDQLTKRVQLQDSSAVVVALGHNNSASLSEGLVNGIVSDIQAINSVAQIYFVNLASSATSPTAVPGSNQVLSDASLGGDFNVIDWFSLVYGEGVDQTANLNELEPQNSYLNEAGSDLSTEGEDAYANLIAQEVIGSAVSSGLQSSNPSAAVSGSSNTEYAYNYLMLRFGLQPHQSAGIVGNLIHESGVDPVRAEGSGYQTISSMSEVTSGRGFGIAQWTTQGRQDNWREFAQDRNEDPLSLDLQLEFLWHEISSVSPGFYGYEELLASTTVDEATWIFLSRFERPAKVIDDPQYGGRSNYRPSTTPPTSGPALETQTTRVNAANEVLADYGNGASPLNLCNVISESVNEPSYAAIPAINIDGSPRGAHTAANCSDGLTDGASALREYIESRWSPPVTTIGGWSCRAILHDPSNPTSIHGLGRALDVMIDGTTADGLAKGNEIRNFVINNAEELGIQRVIWNRFTWAANQDGWRPYGAAASSPHTDHLHIEINIEAGNNPDLI